jgi:hypothetical protein
MVARYFGATAWVLLSIVGAFNGSLTVPNTDRTFMELGFKKVVSRWNVRRDTTKVRIMTENSRAEALATIEAHHQHSFGGCHLSCFGDWPCDAHKFATLYIEPNIAFTRRDAALIAESRNALPVLIRELRARLG